MKNYKVIATRFFRDSNEIDKKTGLKVERQVNDEFYCTKERYEFLKANNAVKLVEVQSTIDDILTEEKTIDKIVNAVKLVEVQEDIETAINEITEEEFIECVEELMPTIEKKVEQIVEVKPKPKKKKSSKK